MVERYACILQVAMQDAVKIDKILFGDRLVSQAALALATSWWIRPRIMYRIAWQHLESGEVDKG
jgi:hypothetical protein